jgi:hypothetical protein
MLASAIPLCAMSPVLVQVFFVFLLIGLEFELRISLAGFHSGFQDFTYLQSRCSNS